jgi:Ca2+-binding RTX toxin-like protein
LHGGLGKDILFGGEGDDILLGGADYDILTGGSGQDQFHFTTGKGFTPADLGIDRITDFSRVAGDIDKISLSGKTFSDGTSFASVNSDALA